MYYTKYRPQTFAELDNERIKQTLVPAILNNKVSHAYLLTGPRGTGKTTTARLIAKTLNCQNRKTGEEPCNRCDSCLAIMEGRSLDVVEIDAASNTSVEDIRDLREKVKLAPTVGPYKIYIIDEVHMLSNSAFNALLKTLEEPPSHVVFVLATTDPQKLPATVISRCQRFDFSAGSREETTRAIKRAAKGEGLEIEEKVLEQIVNLSSGSFRDAHKILEQLASQSAKITMSGIEALKPQISSDVSEKFLIILISGKVKEAWELLDRLSAQNGQIKSLIEETVALLREEIMRRSGILPGGEKISLTTAEITDLLSRLNKAYGELRDAVTPALPLELLVVEWHNRKGQPISKIEEPEERAKEEKTEIVKTQKTENVASDRDENLNLTKENWQEVLAKTKPFNHSLTAFLRAAKPREFRGKILMVEVAYKFHLEKLSEEKNRHIVEEVISDIIGRAIRVKFELARKE